MMRIFRVGDWPLALKLVSAMLIVSIVPLAIVGYLTVSSTRTALTQSIGQNFRTESIALSDWLERAIVAELNVVLVAGANDDVQHLVEESNGAYSGSDASIVAALEAQDQIWRLGDPGLPLIESVTATGEGQNAAGHVLSNVQSAFPNHIQMFVTDAHGATVGATGYLPQYYWGAEDWWQAVLGGAAYVSDPIFMPELSQEPILQTAVPIVSGHGGEVLGVIHSTLEAGAMVEHIASLRLGETGRAEILNGLGSPIFVFDTLEVIAMPSSLAQHFLNQGAHFMIAPAETGVETIFGHSLVGLAANEAGEMMDHDEMSMDMTGGEFVDQSAMETDPMDAEMPEEHSEMEDGHSEMAGAMDQFDLPSAVNQAFRDLGWVSLVRQDTSEALAPVASATQLTAISLAVAFIAAAGVAFLLAYLLTRQVNRIQALFSEIGKGNFGARVEVLSHDELGRLAASLNTMLDDTLALIQTREERDAMQAAVIRLLEQVSVVADGDLTVQADVTEDVTGAIADSFNFTVGELRRVIGDVQAATQQVSSSSADIRTKAQALSAGAERQALQIERTSTAIHNMAESIQQVSQDAEHSAEMGDQALLTAKKGTEAVNDTVLGMNRIRDQVQETSKRIKRLGESSQEVGDIVQLISDIADRTSILALNASIQASMAGEAGRGFAVVAEEVEQLAVRSAEATAQIDTLIRMIQNETNEAVAAMEGMTEEVVTGSVLADEAGQALKEIEGVSNRLADLNQSISTSSQMQAKGSIAVAKAMQDISQITSATAEGTKQTSSSIAALAMLADELRGSVDTFKLPDGNGRKVEAQPVLETQRATETQQATETRPVAEAER